MAIKIGSVLLISQPGFSNAVFVFWDWQCGQSMVDYSINIMAYYIAILEQAIN
jgi:hypothetical protein